MKIFLRAFWWPDVHERINNDSMLNSKITNDDKYYDFDTDDDLFSHFLDVINGSRGCRFSPHMKFTNAEILQSKYYQLDCRGKIILESNKDYEFNAKELELKSFISTDADVKIRFPDKLYLSKIDLNENVIGCATNWLREFILPINVSDVFRKYKLIGFETRNIFNLRNKEAHEKYHQLYTDKLMPKAELDIASIKYINDIGGYSFRELGCLTYDMSKINNTSDFYRTAENWSSNYCPIWIVSSSTKKCYDENKLKGWNFRPVLDKGSELYENYSDKWSTIINKVNHCYGCKIY